MQIPYKQNLIQGVNLDLDETRVQQMQAIFIKNMTANVNANPTDVANAGSNQGVYTPLEGNLLFSFRLPSGKNYCIGFYDSEQTNEGYAFIYNDLGHHSILVLRGTTGILQTVYEGALLPFVLDPKYFIAEGRCVLVRKSYIDPVSLLETNFSFLLITNNLDNQLWISVEDSIATSSFTTPAPYFIGAGSFYDPAILIHYGVPTPMKCIGIKSVASVGPELEKQNVIIKNAWQFRIKWIDVYGRESEHGYISDQYISIVGGGCVSESNSMPRCLDITIEAGSPLVDCIQIEYRKWIGSDLNIDLSLDWAVYDIINKWDNAAGLQWYQRSINPDLTYDPLLNSITYRFCGDKNNLAIDPNETSRSQPGLARTSSGINFVNKKSVMSNNVRGFQPLDPEMIKKVSLSVTVPHATECPDVAFKTIRFYANPYRPYNDSSALIRGSFGNIVWGDENGDCTGGTANSYRCDQVFGDQTQPGFIAYLAGTNYKTIGIYGYFDIATHTFTPLPGPTYGPAPGGMETMIEFTFVVPPGIYVARLASHKATINDADLTTTSTYVAGFTTLNAAFTAVTGPNARRTYASNPIKELVIDCTLGDVIYNFDLAPMLIILDLSGTLNIPIDGYLFEQNGQNIPIEMAPITFLKTAGSGNSFGSFFTDHNGFFFGVAEGSIGVGTSLKIYSDLCDGASPMRLEIINFDSHIKHGDGTGVPSGTGVCTFGGLGNWKNRIYLTNPPASTFSTSARRIINQKVLLCSSTTGIPGMTIVMTKGAVGVTDGNGIARIVAHNRYHYSSIVATVPFLGSLLPDYSALPDSTDHFIFTQRGFCKWYDCSGGCFPALPNANVLYDGGCCSPYPTCQRIENVPDVFVFVAGVNLKGPATGARYPWGFVLFDSIGRHGAVQRPPDELGFIDTPNLNDPSYRRFVFPQISFNIAAGFVVPTEFKKMKIVIGENTLWDNAMSWAVDWVQFVDSAGNTTTPTAAIQIRIYWTSLNEYNKQSNFSTNTLWQIQTTGTAGASPVIGDVVQFIKNGDGTWFNSVTSAPITYNKDGSFFTINFTNDLASLVNGALFRIIRPKTNQNTFIYYGQCFDIDIIDGVPRIISGNINYFDSYFLNRMLPVPILKGQPGPIPPGGTPVVPIQYSSSNNNPAYVDYTDVNVNSNQVVIMSITDAQTSFPFLFEGPSPSDFWGSHLSNRGIPYFANPYEAEQRSGTEVATSNGLLDRGFLNGLSYFEATDIVTFDRNTWGDITVMLADVGICLVICDTDHFYLQYNTTDLKVVNGQVVSQNPYKMFNAPERNPGTPFGCPMFNINTIRKFMGIVMWLDGAGKLIQSTFGKSTFINTGFSAYLQNKYNTVNINNLDTARNGLFYPVAGIDYKTKEYLLTFFKIEVRGGFYINNLDHIDLNACETLIIDLQTGILKGFASFTPEYYGSMEKFYVPQNLFSFKEGGIWSHHAGIDAVEPFNNFYEVQCKKTLTVVVNAKPDKVKRFMYTEVYCSQHLFIVTKIDTESGQTSRILEALWDKRDKFYCADYKCDLNTVFGTGTPAVVAANPLYEGETLYGRWAKVKYQSTDKDDSLYCEVSSVVNVYIEETNSAE